MSALPIPETSQDPQTPPNATKSTLPRGSTPFGKMDSSGQIRPVDPTKTSHPDSQSEKADSGNSHVANTGQEHEGAPAPAETTNQEPSLPTGDSRKPLSRRYRGGRGGGFMGRNDERRQRFPSCPQWSTQPSYSNPVGEFPDGGGARWRGGMNSNQQFNMAQQLRPSRGLNNFPNRGRRNSEYFDNSGQFPRWTKQDFPALRKHRPRNKGLTASQLRSSSSGSSSSHGSVFSDYDRNDHTLALDDRSRKDQFQNHSPPRESNANTLPNDQVGVLDEPQQCQNRQPQQGYRSAGPATDRSQRGRSYSSSYVQAHGDSQERSRHHSNNDRPPNDNVPQHFCQPDQPDQQRNQRYQRKDSRRSNFPQRGRPHSEGRTRYHYTQHDGNGQFQQFPPQFPPHMMSGQFGNPIQNFDFNNFNLPNQIGLPGLGATPMPIPMQNMGHGFQNMNYGHFQRGGFGGHQRHFSMDQTNALGDFQTYRRQGNPHPNQSQYHRNTAQYRQSRRHGSTSGHSRFHRTQETNRDVSDEPKVCLPQRKHNESRSEPVPSENNREPETQPPNDMQKEIEKEMELAKSLDLPVNGRAAESGASANPATLDPDASSFSPKRPQEIYDAHGKKNMMKYKNGMCHFHPCHEEDAPENSGEAAAPGVSPTVPVPNTFIVDMAAAADGDASDTEGSAAAAYHNYPTHGQTPQFPGNQNQTEVPIYPTAQGVAPEQNPRTVPVPAQTVMYPPFTPIPTAPTYTQVAGNTSYNLIPAVTTNTQATNHVNVVPESDPRVNAVTTQTYNLAQPTLAQPALAQPSGNLVQVSNLQQTQSPMITQAIPVQHAHPGMPVLVNGPMQTYEMNGQNYITVPTNGIQYQSNNVILQPNLPNPIAHGMPVMALDQAISPAVYPTAVPQAMPIPEQGNQQAIAYHPPLPATAPQSVYPVRPAPPIVNLQNIYPVQNDSRPVQLEPKSIHAVESKSKNEQATPSDVSIMDKVSNTISEIHESLKASKKKRRGEEEGWKMIVIKCLKLPSEFFEERVHERRDEKLLRTLALAVNALVHELRTTSASGASEGDIVREVLRLTSPLVTSHVDGNSQGNQMFRDSAVKQFGPLASLNGLDGQAAAGPAHQERLALAAQIAQAFREFARFPNRECARLPNRNGSFDEGISSSSDASSASRKSSFSDCTDFRAEMPGHRNIALERQVCRRLRSFIPEEEEDEASAQVASASGASHVSKYSSSAQPDQSAGASAGGTNTEPMNNMVVSSSQKSPRRSPGDRDPVFNSDAHELSEISEAENDQTRRVSMGKVNVGSRISYFENIHPEEDTESTSGHKGL